MFSRTFRIALAIFAFSFLSACASMKSMSHNKEARPGLGYYLPNGDIKVTMTRTTDKNATSNQFKIETVYYADVSRRYSVTIPKNAAGDTQINVKVNSAGLLVSSEYKYEPKIIEAIANLPPKAVSRGGATMSSSAPCQADGDYVQTIDVADLAIGRKAFVDVNMCELIVRITAIGRQPAGGEYGYGAPGSPKNGLYFRMNMPYRVEIIDPTAAPARTLHSEIALSPSGGHALFLKLNRSLFSKAEGKLGFDNGVLTSFEPKNSSEIESGFKLPASILKAYFESVSGLLAFRSKRIENEVAYMAAQEQYKQARAQLKACQDAYATGKPDVIDSNCKDPEKKD